MEIDKIKHAMHSGEIYYENSEVFEEQAHYNQLMYQYNSIDITDKSALTECLKKLLGSLGENSFIMPPLHANWGKHTHIGNRVYVNFNLTLVDDTHVYIGDDVMIGPNVTIITGNHPVDPVTRKNKAQYNLPVTIGKNAWIGAGAIIMPGITIGENSIIGAGSVVTRDIPDNVVAVGSPCRVIKKI